jgi:hypothetical protein
MSKQTAVEWLVENYLPLKRGIELGHEPTVKVVEQAKEMEKQQIQDAFANGVDYEYEYHINGLLSINSEQYYNESFKK